MSLESKLNIQKTRKLGRIKADRSCSTTSNPVNLKPNPNPIAKNEKVTPLSNALTIPELIKALNSLGCSVKFVDYVIKNYSEEQINTALKVHSQQKSVRNSEAFLNRALRQSWPLSDKKPPTILNPRTVQKQTTKPRQNKTQNRPESKNTAKPIDRHQPEAQDDFKRFLEDLTPEEQKTVSSDDCLTVFLISEIDNYWTTIYCLFYVLPDTTNCCLKAILPAELKSITKRLKWLINLELNLKLS